MRLLAALSGAVFAYLVVGVVTGNSPRPMASGLGRRARSRRRPAGTSVSTGRLLVVSVGAAVVTFAIVWAVSGAVPVALAPALAVGLLTRGWAHRQDRRIDEERILAWPDALRDLVAHLQAPMSLHRGLVELGRTGPEPLRPAWGRYEQLSAALDNRAALEAVRSELADPVSDRVVEVLLVAHRQGEAVVLGVLRDLAATTAQDIRLREEIETAQLERRIEARAAAVLPFGVLVLLTSSSAPYRAFYSSARGLVVVALGAGMVAAGTALIRRLGRLPVEQRVLATSQGNGGGR